MRRLCLIKPTPLIAGLLAGLLFAILAVPLNAAPAETNPQHPVLGYDKAHEITLTGNIEQTMAKAPKGSPAGLHIIVAASEGTVDAHLGPFMTREILEALHTGTPVQIVGAFEKAHGRNVLLAREVTVGGRTIRVRSENGFLLPQGAHRHAKAENRNRTAFTGGAR